MSWATTPPEVISAEIYGGAGAAPLQAAALALNNLATELGATANGWTTELGMLTGSAGWTGTGAAAAAAAAQTYISWLTTAEAAVTQAAAEATASANAFIAVHAAVVDPATVVANRTLRASLVPMAAIPTVAMEIATLDGLYAEYWAQDVAAMGAYQAASLAASAVPALVSPTGTVNPISASTSTGASTTTAAASTGLTLGSGDLVNSLDGLIGTPAISNSINGGVNTAAWFVGNTIPTAVSLGHTLAGAAVPAAAVGDVVPDGTAAGVVEGTVVSSVRPISGVGSWAGMGASASVGEAATVGKLSVPATWAGATQAEAQLASSTAPLEGSGWTVAAEEAGGAPVMGAGMPGMMGGAKGAGAFAAPRYGTKPIVMPKSVVV